MEVEKLAEILELTGKEAEIYSLIAQKQCVNAGELIKASGMYRAAVYDILERLIEKGLIGYVKNNKVREFSAVSLSIVRQKLESEKDAIKQKEEALSVLEKQFETMKTKEPEVVVLKGKKGLKTLLNHVLETAKEWHVFGAQGSFKKLFPQEYQLIHSKRLRKKIPIKIIYNSSVRKEKREEELPLIEVKYVDKMLDTPATTFVYGDNVAIVIWSTPAYIMWVKSKDVAKSYENHFQTMWKNAKS